MSSVIGDKGLIFTQRLFSGQRKFGLPPAGVEKRFVAKLGTMLMTSV